MASNARTVGLFVTCLVDLFRPSVAEAAAKLLDQVGFRVVVPAQTCCGQANYNGGDRDGARRFARELVRAFRDCPQVVAPSASCIGMIREYPGLFPEGSAERAAAEDLAARSHELTAFLAREAGALPVPPRWEASAAYHDSCSALRQLGLQAEPRALLARVAGLTLAGIDDAEECCGFGGAFCMRYPEVSAAIADRKVDAVVATGATHLVGADLGCLLHLEGRMQRRGLAVRAVHVAEVLAGFAPGTAGADE
jgi:L-lactate dehydrogenase complex protein LldE